MIRTLSRNVLVLSVCLSLSGIAAPISAGAGVVRTDQYLALQDREARIDRINGFMTRESVREQLTSMGVDPAAASSRVASLTDAELASLDENLQDMPAGGSLLELVLVVFLVLIILDLTGATNIFPTIGPK